VSGRWLLLRRADTVWAIPSDVVRAVHRNLAGAEVELRDSSSLQAEQLLAIAPALDLRPIPSCIPEPPCAVAGLAVWQGQPVLCLDPAGTLPQVLLESPTTALAPGELEDTDGRRPRDQDRTGLGSGH
jgi:hypothetical protein